jgi:hypothetical protein
VSVGSYYPFVERIVASYDGTGRGWTGRSVRTDECISRMKALDVDNKVVWRPGDWCRPDRYAGYTETEQRQSALDEASEGADWVLQLDGDEVIPRWRAFARWLEWAEAQSLDALWYPQRWLFARVGEHVYLEGTTRYLLPAPARPAPSAVRAGAQLRFMRQDESDRHLLDFGWSGARVRPRDGILHFSWVRSYEDMQAKVETFSHAADRSYATDVGRWMRANQHPAMFLLRNAIDPRPGRFRPIRVRRAYSDVTTPVTTPHAFRRLVAAGIDAS